MCLILDSQYVFYVMNLVSVYVALVDGQASILHFL